MTLMAERTSSMSVRDFEKIAAFAARESDSARLEFVGGRIGEKAVPDGDHNQIWWWLADICLEHRPDLRLFPESQGLKVEHYRKGRARPDGSLAPREAFTGGGEWADPETVLMAVEITSYDSDTDRRDRREKPAAYAAAGIPVYLLIDREAGKVVVHSTPEDGDYATVQAVSFGHEVMLPEPVGFAFDTGKLKDYVR
ncbi:Uma2 family endonuclease [Streptomyces sp. NPDC086023]|uniref:Uma2 family endonuclease n=1 Tax=Streptomyces sp. NPDC086023 TaxID=3365746 RepID=UPI0037D86B6D